MYVPHAHKRNLNREFRSDNRICLLLDSAICIGSCSVLRRLVSYVNDLPKTIISREYSSEWKPGDEPYYPVNDAKNNKLYAEYKKLANNESKAIFGGRLGEYKYYDMDKTIEAALNLCERMYLTDER